MSGPELYERRKRRGWTQSQLAQRLSVDRSSIQRWETGKSAMPEKMAKLIQFTIGSRRAPTP
jgi:transcriptional regulator with XRE-family HTH domain